MYSTGTYIQNILTIYNEKESEKLYIYIYTHPYITYGNPLQYSCLENPMDGEDWWAIVHGVAKSQTRLNNFTYLQIHI